LTFIELAPFLDFYSFDRPLSRCFGLAQKPSD
jgi:hypothetical protein